VSNEVFSVTQDPKGYIWIGTLNGLQRYDGRRFLSFNHAEGNPRTLPNDGAFNLYADNKNRIWMRCLENRIGYVNTTDFSFHEVPVHYPEMILRNAESNLVTDRDGHLMLILNKHEILTYNDEAGVFDTTYNPFRLQANWGPYAITQDPVNHDYWIGSDSGLVKYNVKKKTISYGRQNTDKDPIIQAFATDRYTSLPYWDRKNRFWLLSWPPAGKLRLYTYDVTKGKLTDREPDLEQALKGTYHETFGIKEQADGTLWVYGGGVFVRFNESRQNFEWVQPNLPGEFSIRYDGVRNLYEDRERNLWVATNTGLYRFNPAGQFIQTLVNRRFNEEKDYKCDVSDIYQLRNGDIVVTTWGCGLFAYDKDFNPVKRDYVEQGMQLGEGMDWCVHQRANGDIWRAHQGGILYVYHANTKRTEKLQPAVFGESTIRQIAEDHDGNLWLASQGGHLVKWTAATGNFQLIEKFGSIVYRLYTDWKGNIWACTRSHGLFYVSAAEGRIIHNYTANGPIGSRLMMNTNADVVQYDDSTILVASGGLNILDLRTNRIRYETAETGLPSNTVVNVVPDRRGRIWMTVESGLCALNISSRIASIFNENDGLETVHFNEAATCTLQDGRIAMGCAHEFVIIDPVKLAQQDLSPPDVAIAGFRVGDQSLLVDSLFNLKHITLQPRENSIVVEFATLTYQNNFGITYMLENLDKDWVRKSVNQFQAVYSHLPPGHYTLKVRCENGDGVHSKNITELKIVIEPHFWQTWWFYCLVALGILAIVYWLDKQRINRMLALQKVRSDIAGNLHEEVNTTLNNINLLSEMARIKADKEIERSKEYISQISNKSHNMIIAMDDILWSIDPENDSMEKSLLRMMEYADSLKNQYGAGIEIALDKKVRSLKPDMKTRHEAFLIFKEALRMIVQYAGGKHTLVHIDLFKHKLSIKLHDSTATLDSNTPDIEQSIRDMHNRASHIGADLDIQHESDGVTIILLVPLL
jgi:ligand-binding sensor domain-containing protein